MVPFFQFPFDEPPQDEIGEPSHRKENLNRNPSAGNPTLVQLSTKSVDPEDQDQDQHQIHRQDDPAADKVPGLTNQGTDFTATIPTNREESNNDQGQPFGDGQEDKRYNDDETGIDGGEPGGGSNGSPYRHQVYSTKATTQRIRPDWFMTPHYPGPLRSWVPYTQSTSMPRRVTPNVGGLRGVVPTVVSNIDNEGVTRGRDMSTKGISSSNTEGHDVNIDRDDVRTGLETNERNGYVSDGNLTDGMQGNENKPEARAWTGPIPRNLHTKQTTGPIPYILNTKLTTVGNRHHSPMPPDTFSTLSPTETKQPKTTESLPPLAPLTKWPKVTTATPDSMETIHNPYTPGGDGSYPGGHNNNNNNNNNHGDGYHHDGDMEQYYRDYHGDEEMPGNTSNQGYRRPEEKQAPAHEVYGTGRYNF